MQSKNPLRHLLAFILLMVPFGYLAWMWNDIPGSVALHFGPSGAADRFGDKTDLLIQTIIIAAITLLAYVLVVNVHIIDKKRTKGVKPPMFDTIAFAAVLFMSIISTGIIVNGIYPESSVFEKMILPAIGMFFVFMGNVMYSIKPNRFVGVRIPWTLNNDDNWKSTHRLASKLFFVGGLLITLVSLGFKTEVAAMFMSAITLVIVLVTVGYSYIFYRNNKENKAV